MKKGIVIGALALTIIGGAGSVYTAFNSFPKLDKYMDDRRNEILDSKVILDSQDKVNTINLERFSENPLVYIKKSHDNHTRVTVTTLRGKSDYAAELKDGALNFRKVADSYRDVIGISEMDARRMITSYFSPNRKDVGDMLDYMAVTGTRVQGYSIENYAEWSSFKVTIEIPESVNLNIRSSKLKGYEVPRRLKIDNGLIKDTVTADASSNYGMIEYDGTINNVVVNGRGNKYYNGYIEFLGGIDYNKTHIKKLTLNIDPGINTPSDMKADEIVINFSNEKVPFKRDVDEELFKKEFDFARFAIENKDGDDYDDRDDDLAKKLSKLDNSRKFEDKFREEVDYARGTIEPYGFGSEEVNKHFYNMFDINVPVLPEMANRLVINAPERSVRVVLEEGFNPKVAIKTKDGVDTRFFLMDKIPSALIPAKNSVKELNGDMYGYVKKLDKNFGDVKGVLRPEIVVNSKSAYIVDQEMER